MRRWRHGQLLTATSMSILHSQQVRYRSLGMGVRLTYCRDVRDHRGDNTKGDSLSDAICKSCNGQINNFKNFSTRILMSWTWKDELNLTYLFIHLRRKPRRTWLRGATRKGEHVLLLTLRRGAECHTPTFTLGAGRALRTNLFIENESSGETFSS